MPKLEPLCTLHATLKPPVDVGATPSGARQIFDVTGGRVEGERVSGRVVASGGDWILVGADGVGRLDVRATVETDDGANVYVQYHGVLVFNDRVMAAMAGGGATEFGDTDFFTTPRFETGDPRYAWLNSVVAVGQGRLLPGAVEYRIFAVRND